MKFKFAKSILLAACLAAAAVMASGGSATAQDQQGYPNTILSLSNIPPSLIANQYVGYATNYIPLRRTGLGYSVSFVSSNAVTGTVYSYFYPTIDGTNIGVLPFAVLPVAGNGTNLATGYTNWSRYSLEGFQGMFVTVSNGQGSTIYMNTNLYVVTTNSTLPNTNAYGGAWFNRPNQ